MKHKKSINKNSLTTPSHGIEKLAMSVEYALKQKLQTEKI
jgi:hypothetical protein